MNIAKLYRLAPAALLFVGFNAVAASLDYQMPYSQAIDDSGAPALGLTIVNSADFSQRKTVLPNTTAIRLAHTNYGGDLADGQYVDMRPYSVVYQQGAQFFRVNLRSGNSTTPVQVSSESAGAAVCDSTLLTTDFTAPQTSALLYQVSGTDGGCDTADDIFRYTRLNAKADAAPKVMSLRSLDISPMYAADWSYKGLVVLEGTTLKFYKPDFVTSRTLASDVTRFEWLARTATGEAVVLINSSIRKVGVDGKLVAGSLRKVPAGFSFDGAVNDATTLYFDEKNLDTTAKPKSRVMRVPLDDSAEATQMLTSNFDDLTLQGLTSENLIYIETTLDTSTFTYDSRLKRIAKIAAANEPAPKQLQKATNGFFSVAATDANRVFYNLTSFASTYSIRAYLRDDNATLLNDFGTGSTFGVGVIASDRDFETQFASASHLVLTTGATDGVYANAALWRYRVADNVQTQLATLPSNTAFVSFFATVPAAVGTIYLKKNNELYGDVFAADMDNASYLRQTSTATVSEVPVY